WCRPGGSSRCCTATSWRGCAWPARWWPAAASFCGRSRSCTACDRSSEGPAPRASVDDELLLVTVDVLLPLGKALFQVAHDLGIAERQVAPLGDVGGQFEQHFDVHAILHVLPVAVPDGLLLARGPVDAPEERACDFGLFAGEDGQ